MKKIELTYPKGATPLDPNELGGLIPTYIKTQPDLNKLEQENILEAQNWAYKKKHDDILNYSFVIDIHKRMFRNVWKWAGTPRTTEKNIGVPKEQILPKIKLLLDDVKYWIANNTYSLDEIAVRFHHRLVHIHVFANGNGRHARLMTDILLELNNQDAFSWGAKSSKNSLEADGATRSKYIAALQSADSGNYSPLLAFVRS